MPKEDSELVIEPDRLEPTVVMAITEAMPMIMPNIVKKVRILLALKLVSAIMMLSTILVIFTSPFIDYLAIGKSKDAVTFFSQFVIVCN